MTVVGITAKTPTVVRISLIYAPHVLRSLNSGGMDRILFSNCSCLDSSNIENPKQYGFSTFISCHLSQSHVS